MVFKKIEDAIRLMSGLQTHRKINKIFIIQNITTKEERR